MRRPLLRSRRQALAALAVAVLCGLVMPVLPLRHASPEADAAPAATWRTVVTSGAARSYLLAVPPGRGPHPLLVVLHGLNQRTPGFLEATGVVDAALRAGVAVVGPETPDKAWNDGRFGPHGRDDDGYVVDVVAQTVGEGIADPDRVTLAGFSNGAGMSMELSSRHPDLFAGLVLVGGELLEGQGEPRPEEALPTVLVHGTADRIQPWEGRARRSARMPAQVGVPRTVAAFAAAAGAQGRPAVSALKHRDGAIPVSVERYEGGAAPLALYRLEGAGHVWPVQQCPAAGCSPSRSFVRRADVSATALAVSTARTARLAGE